MILMVDPPSGWKYGFPKSYDPYDKPLTEWLLENGYPQHEIDKFKVENSFSNKPE